MTIALKSLSLLNSGGGNLYATPSEFVHDVLREKKERLEAAEILDAILDGYQDVLQKRTVPYCSNLLQLLMQAGE